MKIGSLRTVSHTWSVYADSMRIGEVRAPEKDKAIQKAKSKYSTEDPTKISVRKQKLSRM